MAFALSGGNQKGPEATADSCDAQDPDVANCITGTSDYTTAGATLCLPDLPICGTLSLTRTKYGDMYCGFSGGVGEGDSFSIQQGILLGPDTRNDIQSFVGGWGVSGSACAGSGIGTCATFVDGQPQMLPWDPGFIQSFGVDGALTGSPSGTFGPTVGSSYAVIGGYDADCASWGSTVTSHLA